jgi:hypothetical protein
MPLRQLHDNTGNFVNYRWNEAGKELGRLGVTLVRLDPVLRQILAKNRRGAIHRAGLDHFEAELRDTMRHAQFADYDMPLRQFFPLDVYGKNKQYLGLRFQPGDYRLAGDRAMVEAYIRENYDREDGNPLTKRFLAGNLQPVPSRITIGEVNYANLTSEEGRALQANPSQFVFDQAYTRMEQNEQEFGSEFAPETIVFPEVVTLNGLQIFCQQRS